MKKLNKKLDFADFRYQVITTLAKNWKSPFTGILHKKGAVVEYTAIAKYFGKQAISFPIPNMTALFLHFSNQLYEESQSALVLLQPRGEKKQNDKFVSDVSGFFDILEKRIGSIVFAYTALEVFANEQIPNDFIYKWKRKDDKCEEVYSKEQIERWIELNEKLSMILPDIFKVKIKKGAKAWSNFKSLKKIRDDLIHIKSKDLISVGVKDSSIWNKIAIKELPNYALVSKSLIKSFYPKEKNQPRWLKKLPF